MMTSTPKTILFLAANPQDTGRLRLDQELRDIAEGLQRAQKRDRFTLEQRWAVRPREIQRAMLDVNPSIIHFSGHGTGGTGLMFEDEIGNAKLVDGRALAGLFELFADQIDCVILNGCYAELQAKVIAQHIPYVIGMNQAIGDRAAIIFAVGFYDALGAGRDVKFAYKLGCNAIRLEGIAENLTPVLLNQAPSRNATAYPQSKTPTPFPTAISTNEAIEVFISYSHKDEDLKDELYIHLANLTRQNKIKPWQDRAIEAGTEWDTEIKARLESAGVILLLITPRFIASEYCFDKEMVRAMERHTTGIARVIPIIMKPCDWQDTPFSKLQVLPKDAKPVTSWSDQDEALLNVTQGIRRVVASMQDKKVKQSLIAAPAASLKQSQEVGRFPSPTEGSLPSPALAQDAYEFHVFISYQATGEDKQWVRKLLLPHLESAGLKVCLDTRFPLGVPIITSMERAVQQSQYTVVVLSPNYLESDFSDFESLLSQHLGLEQSKSRLILLKREHCEPRLGLRMLMMLDMTDEDEFETNINRLVHQLRLPPLGSSR
ncbi:tir domain-containing protein [Leptolyngbya sp. Heron Island J]|uniref:TIR domain-containing protein n=1 Tax=Leptolyngbya sp. Heron Island J TaxID=1385935 RepID=UPI0003B97839|nr:TIR domain-containing protein [Leptolyngbya sp. Heron Island J]ESA37115.1 tir domain-containing protein [Leptolyngbya sp. Heron Island J]